MCSAASVFSRAGSPSRCCGASIRRAANGRDCPTFPRAFTIRVLRRSAASCIRLAGSRLRARRPDCRRGGRANRAGAPTPKPRAGRRGRALPTARGALPATAHENKIYAIGGAKNPTYSTPELRPTVPVENMATNEALDIASGTWSAAAPMLTARNHHGASLIDGKIYVVGGRIGSTFIIGLSNNISTNEVYDIAKNTWAAVLGMPTPRSGVGTAVLNGRMHVLGGEAYLNDLVGTYRTHEAFDPKTNAWQRLPPMPTPRHGLAVAEIG